MAALLHADRLRERLVRALPLREETVPGRRYRLANDALVPTEEVSVGGDVVAVPTEEVLLLALHLPLPSRRERMAALPFAVEDSIADPLDAVHLALGQAVAPQIHIVGVARHEAMRRWLRLIEAAGLDRAALVPDALLLPMPPAGCWMVGIGGGRALVRTGDGAGFAMAEALLGAAWAAGGTPAVMLAYGVLPQGMVAVAQGAPSTGVAAAMPALDLRQGPYAARRRPLPAVGRRMLTVAAAGLLAHGAIAAADTLALRGIAAQREAETRALVQTIAPGTAPDGDIIAAAMARLPASATPAETDRLLPLLARISAAAGPAGQVMLRGLSYDRGSAVLMLDVEAGTEARIAAALTAAGLAATPSSGRVIVRDGAA